MKTRKIVAALAAALLVALAFSACPSPTNVEESRNSTPAVVSIAAIPGVTAPATYGIPVTTITETAQYRGTVSWSPTVTGAFAKSTAYTATITLTAKAGYTLEGVTEDFFTLSGATSVSNTANSGTVTAEFPVTSFMEMASIPTGIFMMGSPMTETGGNNNERPQHSVTLSAFYIGKHEVTQEQWHAVMGTTIQELQGTLDRSNDYGRGDTYPVYYVNWYQALVFCNKLSIKEGLSPAYSINGSTDPAIWGTAPTANNATWNDVVVVDGSSGYRLPTEAQWEYACRAGTTTAYNTGTAINDNAAWYKGNSEDKTHEVGRKAPNAWGLYDMHGNVLEWCWDWLGTYPTAEVANPTGATSGTTRILRGGSWYYNGQYLRSAVRSYMNNYSQFNRHADYGFRVVRPSE